MSAQESGGFLAAAREREQSQESEPLRELGRATIRGKVLAVCERGDGSMVLARVRERGKQGEDGKRSRDHGTEEYVKPSALLADFADAVEAGLL
jgi:hypothetical protein